eukprot:6492367-Amphidinium_carterae.1
MILKRATKYMACKDDDIEEGRPRCPRRSPKYFMMTTTAVVIGFSKHQVDQPKVRHCGFLGTLQRKCVLDWADAQLA